MVGLKRSWSSWVGLAWLVSCGPRAHREYGVQAAGGGGLMKWVLSNTAIPSAAARWTAPSKTIAATGAARPGSSPKAALTPDLACGAETHSEGRAARETTL